MAKSPQLHDEPVKIGAPWVLPIGIILGLPFVVISSAILVLNLLAEVKGCEPCDLSEMSQFLVAFPAMILSSLVFIFLFNVIVFLVPSTRKMTESYLLESGLTNFWGSQCLLLRTLGFACLPLIPLLALGFCI